MLMILKSISFTSVQNVNGYHNLLKHHLYYISLSLFLLVNDTMALSFSDWTTQWNCPLLISSPWTYSYCEPWKISPNPISVARKSNYFWISWFQAQYDYWKGSWQRYFLTEFVKLNERDWARRGSLNGVIRGYQIS